MVTWVPVNVSGPFQAVLGPSSSDFQIYPCVSALYNDLYNDSHTLLFLIGCEALSCFKSRCYFVVLF